MSISVNTVSEKPLKAADGDALQKPVVQPSDMFVIRKREKHTFYIINALYC